MAPSRLAARHSPAQLVRLIRAAAAGELAPELFTQTFAAAHQALERAGGWQGVSAEQAEAIGDVVWALTFYRLRAEQREAALSLEGVLTIVRHSAGRL